MISQWPPWWSDHWKSFNSLTLWTEWDCKRLIHSERAKPKKLLVWSVWWVVITKMWQLCSADAPGIETRMKIEMVTVLIKYKLNAPKLKLYLQPADKLVLDIFIAMGLRGTFDVSCWQFISSNPTTIQLVWNSFSSSTNYMAASLGMSTDIWLIIKIMNGTYVVMFYPVLNYFMISKVWFSMISKVFQVKWRGLCLLQKFTLQNFCKWVLFIFRDKDSPKRWSNV